MRAGLFAPAALALAHLLAAAAPQAAAAAGSPRPEMLRPPPSCVSPAYPREALRYELEGVVTLRYWVQADGHVGRLELASSSGWALLDDATLRMIQSCAFTPQQAAKAGGAPQLLQYVWSLEGEDSIRPHLVPGSCPASDRFAAFRPYDKAPSAQDGVKVRLLVDAAGQPRGVKTEGALLAPAAYDALVKYVEACRFGFDPELKGQRTDTVYGRVVLR